MSAGGFLARLAGAVRSVRHAVAARRGSDAPEAPAQRSLLLFEHTGEVIRAEGLLREAGIPVKIMGPPPELRTGCDMALVFDGLRELAVRELLARRRLEPLRVVPLRDALLEPVSLFHHRDWGRWLMVRAANMKITVDRYSGEIVNISGGGCPDVPYLAALLTGRRLREAEEPRLRGQTLCAFSLQKAFEELRRLCPDGRTTPAPRPAPSRLPPTPSVSIRPTPPRSAPARVSVAAPAHRVWLICGSVPQADFPLCEGSWRLEDGLLQAEDCRVYAPHRSAPPALEVQRGTAALLASSLAALDGLEPATARSVQIRALLAGDTGDGAGSKALYAHLQRTLPARPELRGLTFHYLYPDVDGHSRVLRGLEGLEPRPLLVADAGFMYVAKMSGYAGLYDFFTPDAGEMAFLADEKAPHPFYTRGFLLAGNEDMPDLIHRAAARGNCAKNLIVKGKTDRIVLGCAPDGPLHMAAEISTPDVPFMEPIGGTGDMLTGSLTALLAAGFSGETAAVAATRANRLCGALARPDPATPVARLLPFLPEAVGAALRSAA